MHATARFAEYVLPKLGLSGRLSLTLEILRVAYVLVYSESNWLVVEVGVQRFTCGRADQIYRLTTKTF